jgi:hypothetical protein
MSPDDPNAELDPSDPSPVRRLGLMRGRPPSRLDEPDLNIDSKDAPTRVMRLRQDIDDANHRLYDESGWCINGAPTFNCEGSMAAAPPHHSADVDDLDESTPSGATASLRFMVVPGDAEKEANALRYLELMLGQMLDHSYSDNLNALNSAEVDRDIVLGSLPQRVFTVKVGSHILITDHPNVMRLLEPLLGVHRCTAADLPEAAHRINVALTLTPARRLV